MSVFVSGQKMRDIATVVKSRLPEGVGFALLVFDREPGMLNYVSNSDRSDMKKQLEELIAKWDSEFPTPEHQ